MFLYTQQAAEKKGCLYGGNTYLLRNRYLTADNKKNNAGGSALRSEDEVIRANTLARRLVSWRNLTLFYVCSSVLTGCQTVYVMQRDVLPGTYRADLDSGAETIVLRKDGTVTTVYKPNKGKVQTVNGTWKFKNGALNISNTIYVDENSVPGSVGITGISGLNVVDAKSCYTLVMNDDTSYFLFKDKTPTK